MEPASFAKHAVKSCGGVLMSDMSDLLAIQYQNDRPTVLGRELHAALGVATRYNDWFERMREYGFVDGTDFYSFLSESIGGRPAVEHKLSIAMAKELCMLQRSEKGRQFRQYLIRVEEAWNTPEMVMKRALEFATRAVDHLQAETVRLTETVAVQNQQIAEMRPKASYYDVVLNCKDLVSVSIIAKDYGWSARRMNDYLHAKKVQFKQGDIWLVYQKYAQLGYTSTKTNTYAGRDGEPHTKPHTYWTQKGRLFIYNLLQNDGILPLIERGAS